MIYRPAQLQDVDAMTELRIRMQWEVGNLTDSAREPEFRELTRRYLRETIPAGGFLCWVAELEESDAPTGGLTAGALVSANGAAVYEKIPSVRWMSGRQAYVSNVYTRPEWRGRGIATRLMKGLIDSARAVGVTVLRLEATAAGKPVYEKVGFKPNRYFAMEIPLR
jgi:ribosomal protein S18 acetylase RimI-like enzyme